jgi:hypothetical protein
MPNPPPLSSDEVDERLARWSDTES